MIVPRITYESSRGRRVAYLSIAFTAIAGLMVLLRLWTRLVIVKKPGLEDVCILVALLAAIGYTVLLNVQAEHGLGLPESQLSEHDRKEVIKVMNT
jgi:hypothetical protein